jgi:Raf kinase inhibitor-like YbhB/YbcL family protein
MENLIISIDFDKQSFPKRHTCDGENISPAITIDRIASPYLAIIVQDAIGPDTMFTHWLIWNIEARDRIPENIPKEKVITQPFTAVQGRHDFGDFGYTGPCPPAGEVHTYFFNVYGLDAPLDIPPGSSLAVLNKAMENHMVQYGGQAYATYERAR